jgi:hypothetical protein
MIDFDLIEKIYSTWDGSGYKKWSKDWEEMRRLRESELKTLESGSDADKMACISGLYGIFDASVKGNIYTYYFWYSDESIGGIYNYYGKRREREWRKLAKCVRVDYNYRTGESVSKEVRWNKRCVENAGRMI